MAKLLLLLSALAVSVPFETVPKAFFADDMPTINMVDREARNEISSKAVGSKSISQAGDGLFYIDAMVNGASVQFVVDSGSSLVILNARDAARAGVLSNGSVEVDTAGGSTAMRRAQIKRVALAGRTLSDVDALIVQRDLPVSLLGQSALTQLGSVKFQGNRLELQ